MASALYVADKIIERLQAAQYLRIPLLRNYDADYDIVAKEIAKHIDANDNARIAELEAALHQAQSLLRSTQANWNEQAYFDADNVITNALGK